MVAGPFKMMKHRHVFEQKDGYTLMTDEFLYESPLGILGKAADALFLRKHNAEFNRTPQPSNQAKSRINNVNIT
jgi:ligand-binding SRPBCC domain-containing protein